MPAHFGPFFVPARVSAFSGGESTGNYTVIRSGAVQPARPDRGENVPRPTIRPDIWGVYLLVGLLGFVPPLLAGSLPGVLGPLKGLLLGLFAVNLLHSLTHLAIGVAGLALYKSFSGAKAYALALGIAYAGLFLLGVLSEPVGTLGGILPPNAPDDILHIATALVALGAYFASRRRNDVDARRVPSAR